MGHPPADEQWLTLGGSFNPIHAGHLICARHAAEVGGFRGVRLVPTAANPHKGSVDLAAAGDRLTMCRLAVAGDPMFEVDPIEIERPGPSYTIETAESLIARGVAAPVQWLIGTDLLARLHTWHRFDEFDGVVRFVVMRRAGDVLNPGTLDPRVRSIVERLVKVPQVQISSTAIRQRVRASLSVAGLVPAAVERHIRNHSIYL